MTSTSFGKHYYDARGNLINSSGVSQYQYDSMDRLITATVTGGTAIYGYDHGGRRIKQTVGVTVTNYLWDEASAYGDVVLETDNSGAIERSYTTGQACPVCDVSGLISQKSGSTVSYYLKDGQGNVRALTNPSGGFVSGESYRYNAYGELQSGQTNPASKYLYTGQQFDQLTGLYSLRARYYNPSQGRFNSRDTYPVNFNNPIELNRYGYTASNPINGSDPLGQMTATASYASVSKLVILGAIGVTYGGLRLLGVKVEELIARAVAEISYSVHKLMASAISETFKLRITLAVAYPKIQGEYKRFITVFFSIGAHTTDFGSKVLWELANTIKEALLEWTGSPMYFDFAIGGRANKDMHAERLMVKLIKKNFASIDESQKLIQGVVANDFCPSCVNNADKAEADYLEWHIQDKVLRLYKRGSDLTLD
jgi:RHS repeat-associated protein